jgi:hypothetical protein
LRILINVSSPVHEQFTLHGVDLLILHDHPPRGLDHVDHRLASGVSVDALDRDLWLTVVAVVIERFEQRGVGARKLVRLTQVLPSVLGRLFADHGAPVAFHGGVAAGEELRRNHDPSVAS